ncbi:MAG TPA: hypothetical protein VMU87_17145 [Stellaceae bacterium]|nr:hypothetical protein [Stellaceae bacterium]
MAITVESRFCMNNAHATMDGTRNCRGVNDHMSIGASAVPFSCIVIGPAVAAKAATPGRSGPRFADCR